MSDFKPYANESDVIRIGALEIENRIDDSSSTAARISREPVLSSSPWVETIMKFVVS